jgi:hypothetical protein
LGGSFSHPTQIVRKAMESIEELKNANARPQVKNEDISSHKNWIVPAVGHMKINWDATVNKAEGKMGIGVIVRDHVGEVLETLQAPGLYIIDLATTALRAAIFARELGYQQVELEGDTIQIVQTLKDEGKNWCRYGLLIENARFMLNSLHLWSVNHVKREENVLAHRQAKEALSLMNEQVHMENDSHCIVDLVTAECFYIKDCVTQFKRKKKN